MEVTLRSLPATTYLDAVARGIQGFFTDTKTNSALDADSFGTLATHILFEIVLVDSKDCPPHIRATILSRLEHFMHSLIQLHATGTSDAPLSFTDIGALFEPLVLHELKRPHKDSSTLLFHLLLTKETLGDTSTTSLHVMHLMMEVLFIGWHALSPCLRVIFTALSLRPSWRQRVEKEISEHSISCPFSCSKHSQEFQVRSNLAYTGIGLAKSGCQPGGLG